MQSFIWKALIGVAFTGGLMALGAGVAYADNTTSGDDGTGSGSQAIVGLNAPITVGGSAISVLGDSSSSGSGSGSSTTPPASGSASGGNTNGNTSLLGGSQGVANANAPVTVNGNAISLIGDSGTASSSVGSPAGATGSASSDGGSGTTSGDDSTLGGTQVIGDSSAPVTVGGNAISVVGDSSSDGSFAGRSASGSGSTDPNGSNATTDGDNGTLGGTQVAPDATAPVQLSGNAVSVLGDSSTGGAGSSDSTGSGTSGDSAATTDGNNSTLGGTQVIPAAAVPVTATGDAISVIGDSSAGGASTGGSAGSVGGTDTGTPGVTTSGDDGILGGSQLAPAVSAPVTVGGNAISVVGDSSTTPGSGGTGGSVGGVETFPPSTGTSTAALSVEALAETGVPALAGFALGILLLMAGIGVMLRAVALRR